MSAFSDDLHFGPSSQPINLAQFAEQAATLETHDVTLARLTSEWQQLDDSEQDRIQSEFNLDDLQKDVDDALVTPRVSAYIYRVHEENIAALVDDQPYSGMVSTRKGKKRKLTVHAPPQDLDDPDVKAFVKRVELDSLRLFRLDANAALFLRRVHHSHNNALDEIRPTQTNSATAAPGSVVLIISAYTRNSWHPYGHYRISQHALLATQTLADLVRVIDCPLRGLTSDIMLDEAEPREQQEPAPAATSECVVCIEGIAYGDGTSTNDYADRLLRHMELQRTGDEKEDARPVLAKGATPLYLTPFASLPALRLHEPYYLLHQGSCEHYLTVDQIRMWHPAADPADGYPQTLHAIPQFRLICRVCTRVTAHLSIVGDRRLGESPCVVCKGCWKKLGWPRDDAEREKTFAVNLLSGFLS